MIAMKIKGLEQPLEELEDYEKQAKNEEIVVWLQKVRASYSSRESLLNAIQDHLAILSKKNDIDPRIEKSPYYYFFLAHAYDCLGDVGAAIDNIESSVSGFKNLGESSQQAISSWLYGLLLCKDGEFDRAKVKMSDAIKILSDIAREQHNNGKYDSYEKAKKTSGMIEDDIVKVEQQKFSAQQKEGNDTHPKNEVRYNAEVDKKISRLPTSGRLPNQTNDYISIPWLPIFQSISAGPNGIVVMDAPSNADVTLNIIKIYDIPHNIYPIKRLDRQSVLNHIFTYGLVKVEGDSMNNAKPIPINDGDYVLFSKQQIMEENDEENDIVVASHKTSNGSFMYIVKRHMKRENLLVSESSNKNDFHKYTPIEIDPNHHQILGVVIAIAKTKK